MSYIINLTDGTVLATVLDGTTNTQTGLTIIGRNFPSYGEAQNENFIRLLQNFADGQSPDVSLASTPLVGTLWYDTTNNRMKVYDGTNWNTVSERLVGSTIPTTSTYTLKDGDQWFDTANKQLKVWIDSAWFTIGPLIASGLGLSGAVPELVTDTTGGTHVVVKTYSQGSVISISSFDSTFTPVAPLSTAYPSIKPGINILANATINGTANNANYLNGVNSSTFAKVAESNTFTTDQYITGNLTLSANGNVQYTNTGSLELSNKKYQGNINFVVNSANGTVNAINIDGNSALVKVYADPVTNLGVATKGYVDNTVGSIINRVQNVANQFYANLTALQGDYLANVNIINTAIFGTNSNLTNTHQTLDSNVSTLTTSTAAGFTAANASIANVQTQIDTIDAYLLTIPTTFAPLANPTLTGTVTVPTQSQGDNSTKAATTAYVDLAKTTLSSDYNAKFAAEVSARNAAIAANVAVLAPLHSPALTGTPTAPTPSAGDLSSSIATTAFVHVALEGVRFNYTVSSGGPSGGQDGDVWFQIG